MKADRKKHLLEKVIIKLADTINSQLGICKAISLVYCQEIDFHFTERNELESFLFQNKPTGYNEYKEFFESDYWTGEGYWWITMVKEPETRQIRIDYLRALISNIK